MGVTTYLDFNNFLMRYAPARFEMQDGVKIRSVKIEGHFKLIRYLPGKELAIGIRHLPHGLPRLSSRHSMPYEILPHTARRHHHKRDVEPPQTSSFRDESAHVAFHLMPSLPAVRHITVPEKLDSEMRISGTYHRVADSDPLPLNKWVHAAVTYDGKKIRLYRDGKIHPCHLKGEAHPDVG